MSLLDTIKGFFSGASADGESASRMHIIDTIGLPANGGRERMSPRQQFAMVQSLAGFFGKEKIKACALVEGRPLREVADGAEYKGLCVYYVERADQLADRALVLARKYRGALLITQNRKLEDRAQAAGIQTLRASTLRKALDDNGSRPDSGRSGGGRGRGGRRSSHTRREGGGNRAPRQRQSPKPEQAKEKPQEQAPAKKAQDGVSDLIDLV